MWAPRPPSSKPEADRNQKYGVSRNLLMSLSIIFTGTIMQTPPMRHQHFQIILLKLKPYYSTNTNILLSLSLSTPFAPPHFSLLLFLTHSFALAFCSSHLCCNGMRILHFFSMYYYYIEVLDRFSNWAFDELRRSG